jgi:hypothetical protein
VDSYFSDVSPIPDSENPQGIEYLWGNAYDPLDNEYYQFKSDIDDDMLTINTILPMDTSQRKLIFCDFCPLHGTD